MNKINAEQRALADVFYTHFQLPESTKLFVKVAKKTLTDNVELNSADKAIVKDVIKSIEWRYTLKPTTVNLPTFEDVQHEYLEIAILHITVKNLAKTKQVCKLLHSQIPYPTFLVIEFEGAFALSLADKRVSKADNSRLTIAHQYDTGWINIETAQKPEYRAFLDDMKFTNCSVISLYDFYQDLVKKVNLLDAAKFSGCYGTANQGDNNNEKMTQQLSELKRLESQLNVIRSEIKNETQMSQKIKLNLNAKNIKIRISSLKQAL